MHFIAITCTNHFETKSQLIAIMVELSVSTFIIGLVFMLKHLIRYSHIGTWTSNWRGVVWAYSIIRNILSKFRYTTKIPFHRILNKSSYAVGNFVAKILCRFLRCVVCRKHILLCTNQFLRTSKWNEIEEPPKVNIK